MPIPILEQAAANLAALKENPYPGRGIIVGLDAPGERLVHVSFVTGRSPGSRNRRYKDCGRGRVETEVADPTKEKGDPEKTIYAAMAGEAGFFVVSNGRQTDTVCQSRDSLMDNYFDKAMQHYSYEDDSISTPRITAACSIVSIPDKIVCRTVLSILRRCDYDDSCVRNFFHFESLCPGIGHALTTYLTDGDPPPTFRGEPFVLPLIFGSHTAEDIGQGLWDALNADNRVCLAVKMASLQTGQVIGDPFLMNKY